MIGVVLLTFGDKNVPPRPNHPAPGVISCLPEPVEGPCDVFQPRESRLRSFLGLKDRRSLIFSILTGVILPTFGGRNVPRKPNHPAPGVISDLSETVKRLCEVFQLRESRLRLL